MELILTKDVPTLGIANEVVNVKSGYARNYLLPTNKAIPATPAALRERSSKIEAAKERRKQQMNDAQELADRIGRIQVAFERKSSDVGRLFGSVTKEDIVGQLKEMHLIEIDRRNISLDNPIKEIGETQVRIRLETGVSASLTVSINADQVRKQQAAAEAITGEVEQDKEQSEKA